MTERQQGGQRSAAQKQGVRCSAVQFSYSNWYTPQEHLQGVWARSTMVQMGHTSKGSEEQSSQDPLGLPYTDI